MRARDPHEPGRTASSLELFFDLVFVIAVGIGASTMHHGLAGGHVGSAIANYAMVFFAIWWAWMNFTWFATSFATDDWLYRLLTFVQMAGVLVLAAGIAPASDHQDFRLLVLAYVVMRAALVAQWLRAGGSDQAIHRTARVYAIGVGLVQICWLGALLLPGSVFPFVLVPLVAAELAVPIVSERNGQTPWHPHHITERYGEFALIVLGESLLASANAIIAALDGGGSGGADSVGANARLLGLVGLGALTLVVTAALWWMYFWPPHHRAIRNLRSSLVYGYGHYFVFAAAGAFSAGIELEIDALEGRGAAHSTFAAFAYSIPVAVFVLAAWLVLIRPNADRIVNTAVPVAATLVLVDPLTPVPVAVTGVVLAATVAVLVWRRPVNAAAGR